MKAALLLAALLAGAPAAAQDCGRYAEPLAYNACLARHGPTARAVRVGAAPTGRPVHGRPAAVRRRGRSELVFTPGR